MRKVIRDGKVAVVISNEMQWYLTHKQVELLFLPELVELVESKDYQCKPSTLDKIEDYEYWDTQCNLVRDLLNNEDLWRWGNDLVVEWIPVGSTFTIRHGYNNNGEYIDIFNKEDWITV